MSEPLAKDGQYETDHLAAMAVLNGFVSEAQIAEAEALCAKFKAERVSISLSEALLKKGFLSSAQWDELKKKRRAAQFATAIPGYEIQEKIGAGAMGAVYKARQKDLARDVAIKILPPALAKKNPEFVDRFIREARVSGTLNHPNIVAGIAVGEAAGFHYFVMEYVNGETLRQWLKTHTRLPEREAIKIGLRLASALEAAATAGLIHRDIKPDNIMISVDGNVKLCDLGLARLEDDESHLTQMDTVLGTPLYISPEQVQGQGKVDGRADIYSLGATLYHLLTGQPLFSGETSGAVMAQHLTNQTAHPWDLASDLSIGTCDVLRMMLAKDPDQRYQNPTLLRKDLEDILAGQPPRHAENFMGRSSLPVKPGRIPVASTEKSPARARTTSTSRSSGLRATGAASARQPMERPRRSFALGNWIGLGGAVIAASVVGLIMLKADRTEPPAKIDAPATKPPSPSPRHAPSPNPVANPGQVTAPESKAAPPGETTDLASNASPSPEVRLGGPTAPRRTGEAPQATDMRTPDTASAKTTANPSAASPSAPQRFFPPVLKRTPPTGSGKTVPRIGAPQDPTDQVITLDQFTRGPESIGEIRRDGGTFIYRSTASLRFPINPAWSGDFSANCEFRLGAQTDLIFCLPGRTKLVLSTQDIQNATGRVLSRDPLRPDVWMSLFISKRAEQYEVLLDDTRISWQYKLPAIPPEVAASILRQGLSVSTYAHTLPARKETNGGWAEIRDFKLFVTRGTAGIEDAPSRQYPDGGPQGNPESPAAGGGEGVRPVLSEHGPRDLSFTDAQGLSAWRQLEPGWAIQDGALTAPKPAMNQRIEFEKVLSGEVSITYTGSTRSDMGISMVNADDPSKGFDRVIVGGTTGREVGLVSPGKTPSQLVPCVIADGKDHEIKVVRATDVLSVWVDGKEILRWPVEKTHHPERFKLRLHLWEKPGFFKRITIEE